MDWARAKAFIEAVPPGRWTWYAEVAKAGGSPRGAQAVGQRVRRHGDEIDGVHRVLSRDGRVADAWVPARPGLPSGPVGVRDRLEREGLPFDGDRAADTERFTVQDWRP
jgi:alkylated DNA nucleotide flippase Atl1